MIRILHSVSNMDRAGIETMLMNYYRYMDKSKVQFDFLCNKKKTGAYRDAAVAASTGDIPSVRHRVQHAWRYAWWTVLHSGKESTRKAVKIENNMIYWGKRD